MRNETRLHFTDVGKGDVALVFLHYFGGSSKSWDNVIPKLSQKFRCIAIDLPGFGASHGEMKTFSVGTCAAAVAELINVLALKQYVVIGHSMGGKIAMYFASVQPYGLNALVLVAPSPPIPEPMAEKERERLLNAYSDRVALKSLLNTITACPLANDDVEKAVAENLKASHASWKGWVELGSREDISPRMSTVQVPIICICGEKDQNIPTNFLQKEMPVYFPAVSFIAIPDAGHLIPIEAPSALANVIADFAKKQIRRNWISLKL